MTFAVAGLGGLAYSLVPGLVQAGHHCVGLVSRQRDARFFNHDGLDAPVLAPHSPLLAQADALLLCVPDSALPQVARQLAPAVSPQGVLLSCSGSMDVAEIAPEHPHVGVMYPLQSFSVGRRVPLGGIPFFVEGRSPHALEVATQLATSASVSVTACSSAQRLRLHVAAVLASNFVNVLLAAAQRVLEGTGIDYKKLQPLAAEVLGKAFGMNPVEAQTGPAIRNDERVLRLHRAVLLAEAPELLEAYEVLSQLIVKITSSAGPSQRPA